VHYLNGTTRLLLVLFDDKKNEPKSQLGIIAHNKLDESTEKNYELIYNDTHFENNCKYLQSVYVTVVEFM
jgi:hypothetical protein